MQSMHSKADHFRIKIDFSEVTSSFWKQSWFYVYPGSIEDLWRRLAVHFLEQQVHDPEPHGFTYGLFLEDRYLFKNLPVNVLKEDDTLKVKVLHGPAVHMNWDGNRIHLKLEQEMYSKCTQQAHSRNQQVTPLQNGKMDRNSQNIVVAEPDTAESIDQDATTKELEAIPRRAAEPQILTLNSCIPATEDVPNHPVPKVKSSRKRNIPAGSSVFEFSPPISQYEPYITRSKARSRTESLPSDSAFEATNLTEPEAEQIPLKPKKKKSRESVRQDANNITDEANMAQQLPESQDTTMESSDVISSFPAELEQDSATTKRKRTRRRVRKATNASPEPEATPLPQMGTFKGHSFYKPPLSKRSYASDAKTNTLIRFDDEIHDQVNAKPEIEDETLQAKANTQWDEALPLPDDGTTETVLSQFQCLTIPLSVTPAAKSQPAANPGLGNLFALTQSPVVFNRVASASTPSVQPPLTPLIAAREAKPSFTRASKDSSSVQMRVEQRPLQVNGKKQDRENHWEIKDYQQYPLISEPRLNEIIAFKELELSASYEPVMSDYKVAQVHHICPMTKNVKLEIVAGDSNIIRSGKFELEDDEEYVVNLENETESKTKEYVWKDLKETRLIYP